MSVYRTSQADSGQQNPDIRLNDFSGGRVNVPTVMGAAAVPANKSPRSQNIDTTGKSLRKPKGFSKVTSGQTTGDVSSMWYDTFTAKTFVSHGTKWASLVSSTLTDLTGATGLANNAITSFCRVNDLILGVNGVDVPHTWDDVAPAYAAITHPPATWIAGNYPAFCANWTGRAFAAGGAKDPDILYYSVLYDATDWRAGVTATAGGAFRIGSDGTQITALIPLAVGLVIIKDRGVYLLTGSNTFDTSGVVSNFDQTTFDYEQLSTDVNCISPRSWVMVDDSAYVWGTQQVYKLSATQAASKIQVEIISHDIAFDVSTVNKTFAKQVCTAHYPARNQVWFSVAGTQTSTGIDTVHIYDYVNNAWNLRNGYSHKCMANVRDSSNNIQIYSGGYNSNGYIFKQNDTLNYNGAAIEHIHHTAWIPLAVGAKGKANQVIFMLGSQTSGDIQWTYAYDFSDTYYDGDTVAPDPPTSYWNTGGGSTWGNAAGPISTGFWTEGTPLIETLPIFGRGRRIQHRFYSNVIGSDFDILEVLFNDTTVGYV